MVGGGDLDLVPLNLFHPLSMLSPPSSTPLPGAHGWARYSPMGFMLGADQVEDNNTKTTRWHVWQSLKVHSILIIVFIST